MGSFVPDDWLSLLGVCTIFGAGAGWGVSKIRQRYLEGRMDEMEEDCTKKQAACQSQVCEKIDHLSHHLQTLEEKREQDNQALNTHLQEINVTLGRIDERLKASEERMKISEDRWFGARGRS